MTTESGSVDIPRFLSYVIHQQVLPKSVRRREVCLAAAELRDFLHEVDEAVIAGKHKGVDQNAGAFALRHFLERLRNHERVEPEGILVDGPVFERQCRGLAIATDFDVW